MKQSKVKVFNKISLVLLLLAGVPAPLWANNEQLEALRKRYPEEKAIFLEQKQEVLLDLTGDSIRVVSREYSDILHLGDQTAAYTRNKVYLSHFQKLLKIDARTLVPAGKSYKAKKVSNYSEKFEISSGIFYDDSKSISFTYPAIEPGVRTVLDYSEELTDPRFMHSFYFKSYIPVEKAELVLTVHKGIKISHKLFNMEGTQVEFSQSDKGKYTVYRWTAQGLPGLRREENAPATSYVMPHIFYRIEKADCGTKACKTLGDLSDLYAMYWGYVKDLDKKEAPRLQQITDSLMIGLHSEEAKVRSIFYWVQNNIKYIAFENGMRGFIPHDGELVCEKRYGDCKDMASILHRMLGMAGIKSYLTWIGTRDLAYRYSEVPSPITDNHMITTWESGGKYYFLDATSKHTPLGFPSSMIQGKEALLAIDKDTYKVVEVPVMDTKANLQKDQFSLRLEGGTLKGTGHFTLKGYPQINHLHYLSELENEKQGKYITSMLTKGNNKYFVDTYKIRQMGDPDKPLEIEYEHRLEDYIRTVGNEVYINMSLDKFLFNEQLDLNKRNLPVTHDYKFTHSQQAALDIPKGYEVGYLPSDSRFEHDLLSFEIKYRQESGKVIQDKNIHLNHILLQKADFKEWNDAVQKLNEAYRDVLILKKVAVK